jgi:hypothetical protein
MGQEELANEALFLLLHTKMVSGMYKSVAKWGGKRMIYYKLENMGF